MGLVEATRRQLDLESYGRVVDALVEFEGNVAAASKRTGWSRNTVAKVRDQQKLTRDRCRFLKKERIENPSLDVVLKPDPIKRLEHLDTPTAIRLRDFAAFRAYFFKRLTPQFQIDVTTRIAERRSPSLLVLWPPGHGKQLAHDTLVPTPKGMRVHGDLAVGDEVFGSDGKPQKVTALFESGEPCTLRVGFSDGSFYDAHPNHEWTVYDHAQARYRTLETRRIARSLTPGGRFRYLVDLPPAYQGTLDAPMDPYTLGVWLGDGSTSKPCITHSPSDEFDLPYERTHRWTHKTTGVLTDEYRDLKADLVRIGVFGNKHIPEDFFFCSEHDRRSLLEGLIDTDGHVGAGGKVRFINTNERLIADVRRLICSLGYRCSTTMAEPTRSSSGIEGRKRVFTLGFSPFDMVPARLARKRFAAKARPVRRRIAITSIQPCDPVPGRCIEVENPDGIYLVGEACTPTHNSTLLSHDYAVWEMVRARTERRRFSCLLISKSEAMAQAFLLRIKRTLESNKALISDFGRFKPEYPDLWQRGKLLVEGFEASDEKEATFIAAGAGSQVYGWRVNLILVDDLVAKDNSKDAATTDKLTEWFREEVKSRLEPDGQMVVAGTRWSPNDLYGRLLATQDEDGYVYEVIRFKAHDDTRCAGTDCACAKPCGHHPSYPDGCTLWPERYTWRALRRVRTENGSARFAFQYNQEEVPLDDVLVRPEWIEKAKNKDRSVWSFPRNITKVLATLDPSPANWASAQMWALTNDERRWLIAHKRAKMTAPEYIALIREWTLKAREHGVDPTWIVEENAAQRFLAQSTDFQRMRFELGFAYQPHQTQRNKNDPGYGVQMLAPTFEYGHVDLPWADQESRKQCAQLIAELTQYPFADTDDCVMAMWFMEHHIRKLAAPMSQPFVTPPYMPPYLQSRRAMMDMRSGGIQAWTGA